MNATDMGRLANAAAEIGGQPERHAAGRDDRGFSAALEPPTARSKSQGLLVRPYSGLSVS